jgi:hypothetical protein
VEPQPRDTGGRFAKRTAEPAAEPAVEPAAEHGDEHGDATVLEYPEAEPRRPRPRTGEKAGASREKTGTASTAEAAGERRRAR